MKTLEQLSQLGQSVWLDYIDRHLLESGKLKGLISEGLRGMTSNPSIFHQAISSSNDYDRKIIQYKEAGKSTFEIYDELTIKDIQDATDQFKAVFETTAGLDGYVSLEINPQIAHDTAASIEEGKRLFKKVDRRNVMIKVPATPAGFPVIEELVANGINVNVTLIFSMEQYLKTVEAYIKGLERYHEAGGDLSKVRSVASVFVSRVDTMIDKMLAEKAAQESNNANKVRLENLKGKAAVANCRLIYEKSKELFAQETFRKLVKSKANIQRVLWGSTSTKNPDYPDVKYVAELILKQTVNTIPEATLNAFMDHGKAREADGSAKEAQAAIHNLKDFGIDIDQVCLKLLDDGVAAFDKAFVALMEAIEKKAAQLTVTK